MIIRLEHKTGREILSGKSGVEMPKNNFVDIIGPDAGMLDRLTGGFHDEAFKRLTRQLSEGRVRPADYATRQDPTPLMPMLNWRPFPSCRLEIAAEFEARHLACEPVVPVFEFHAARGGVVFDKLCAEVLAAE